MHTKYPPKNTNTPLHTHCHIYPLPPPIHTQPPRQTATMFTNTLPPVEYHHRTSLLSINAVCWSPILTQNTTQNTTQHTTQHTTAAGEGSSGTTEQMQGPPQMQGAQGAPCVLLVGGTQQGVVWVWRRRVPPVYGERQAPQPHELVRVVLMVLRVCLYMGVCVYMRVCMCVCVRMCVYECMQHVCTLAGWGMCLHTSI